MNQTIKATETAYRKASYLGDGVYASENQNGVVITTGHHDPSQADNKVFLEPEVLDSLMRWLAVKKLEAGDIPGIESFNPEIAKQVKRQEEEVELQKQFADWVRKHLSPLDLSESATFDLGARIPYFYVRNRADLSALLSLAPRWEKSKSGVYIQYTAYVDGVRVTIFAGDDALPGTCHTITRTVTIPAQAERTEEITELVCEIPGQTEEPAVQP